MVQNRGMINSILPLSVPILRQRRNRPPMNRRLCRGSRARPTPIVQRLPTRQRGFSCWNEPTAGGAGGSGGDWGTEPWWQTVLGCVFLALVFGFALLVI